MCQRIPTSCSGEVYGQLRGRGREGPDSSYNAYRFILIDYIFLVVEISGTIDLILRISDALK